MNDLPDIVITRARRKTLTVSVKPDGRVEVKAPLLAPKFVINQFIAKHRDWIMQQQQKLKEHPPLSRKKYTEGEVFLYLGKEYTLTIGDYAAIALEEDRLLFPQFLKFRIKKELESWYIHEGEEMIRKQVALMASSMHAEYKDVSFADTKSKWGHCTHDNRLQFNWRLIMAPILVLNYVVVHELAHTTEKNHSRSFWSVVGKYNPSYRQQIKWLHKYGNSLIL